MIPEQVQQYCEKKGWTEPQCQRGIWYTFPPGAVMPNRVPVFAGIQIVIDPEVCRAAVEVVASAKAALATMARPDLLQPAIEAAQRFNAAVARLSSQDRSHRVSVSTQPVVTIEPMTIEQLAQQLNASSIRHRETSDPEASSIEYLSQRYRISKQIAAVRLAEFRDRHHLSAELCWELLQQGKITVKHGVLCKSRGYPRQSKKWEPGRRQLKPQEIR